jgi:hypothetical protein
MKLVRRQMIIKFPKALLLLSVGFLVFSSYLSGSAVHPYSISVKMDNFFSLHSSNSTKRLFEEFPSPNYLGSTWNILISLHSNSTTGVRFTFGGGTFDYWEGPEEFEIIPNGNFSATYIQHYVSDFLVPWGLDYSLLDPAKNASGTFSVQQTNQGYYLNPGTGTIYISNITAWLESRSQTTSPPSSSMSSSTTESTIDPTTTTTVTTTPVRFMTIVLGITIVLVRRRKGRR